MTGAASANRTMVRQKSDRIDAPHGRELGRIAVTVNDLARSIARAHEGDVNTR
jgi:hypothetical protein